MLTYTEAAEMADKHEHKGNRTKPSCSSLPMLEKCSGYESQNSSGEAARLGTILHYILEYDLEELVKKLNLPFGWKKPDDFPYEEWQKLSDIVAKVAVLFSQGWKVSSKEQYFENKYLTGTIDLILEKDDKFKNDQFMFCDYKTGNWIVSTSSAQLDGYIFLAFDKFDHDMETQKMILQPKNDCKPEWTTAREASDRVMNILMGKHMEDGDHCSFCAKAGTCETLANTVGALVGCPELGSEDLKFKLDLLSRVDAWSKGVRAEGLKVIDEGGAIEGWGVQERNNKKCSDVALAIHEVGLDQLVEHITIKAGGLKLLPESMIEVSKARFIAKKRGAKK